VLVVSGLFILGFVAYQLWGTGLETARNQDELTQTLATDTGSADSGDDLEALNEELGAVDPVTAPPMAPPEEGSPVGVITIPKIGLQAVVVEGIDRADLKKGPGRYPGTSLPGQPGNAAIAGHRTTYGAPFNRIDELTPGDEIEVTTPQGGFLYRVRPAPAGVDGSPPDPNQAWWAVKPSQTEVLDPSTENLLTLTACHPKYSASERIIVQAELATPTAAPASKPRSPTVETPVPAAPLDQGLGGDSSALPVALAFLAGALAIGALAWFLGRRWKRWPVYLVATPLILVAVWYCYQYLDRYLPAL